MAIEAADEAQALVRLETGLIRDGVVEHAELIEVPEAFFKTIESSVTEQLALTKARALHGYPKDAAYEVVEDLIATGAVDKTRVVEARARVELEIRRAIEHLAAEARQQYQQRLPISLRALTPLITRRSSQP